MAEPPAGCIISCCLSLESASGGSAINQSPSVLSEERTLQLRRHTFNTYFLRVVRKIVA